MSKLTDNARKIATKYPVFPLRADKSPAHMGGFKNATRDEHQIRELFREPSAELVGVPTGAASGLLVIDIDPDGTAWLEQVRDLLPETRQHYTRRGLHMLFKMPPESVRCSAGQIAPGVDVRADGGYIVWWPAHGCLVNFPLTLADPPEWLVTEIRKGRPPATPGAGGNQDTFDNFKPRTNLSQDEARALLAKVPPDCGYSDWVAYGQGLHHEYGDAGLALWDEWSRAGKKYPGRTVLADKWASFGNYNGPPVTLRLLIKRTAEARPAAPPARVGPFDIRHASEVVNFPPISWTIKGLLPQHGLGVIYAEPGAGKTFLALDLAGHIGAGMAWNSRKTVKGQVLYVCTEGMGGIGQRVKALTQHHDLDPAALELFVLRGAPNLMNTEEVAALLEQIAALGAFAVVIFDTLAQSMPGGNENTGEDMGRVVASCRLIAETLGCLVLLVHHSGKDVTKGARGWSGVKGAVDVEIEVTRDDGGPGTIRVSKQKDGADGDRFGFELVEVYLEEVDGEAVSSRAIRYTAAPKKGRRKLGAVQQAAFDGLRDMAGVTGGAVSYTALINAVALTLPHDQEKEDQRRKQVTRALRSLADARLVAIAGDLVTVQNGT